MTLIKLAILFAFGLGVLIACEAGAYQYTVVSPKSNYTVRFDEITKKTGPIFNPHDVYLSVYRAGRAIIENELVYPAKAESSTRFGILYPNQTWVSDNVLRLTSRDVLLGSEGDEVLVYNDTAKLIAYLRFNGRRDDQFFVFELQPHSSIKLYPQSQTSKGDNLVWFASEAKFVSGAKIETGVQFRNPEMRQGPAHYCLTVKDDQVVMGSKEFSGFTVSGADMSTDPVTRTPQLIPRENSYHSHQNASFGRQ